MERVLQGLAKPRPDGIAVGAFLRAKSALNRECTFFMVKVHSLIIKILISSIKNKTYLNKHIQTF